MILIKKNTYRLIVKYSFSVILFYCSVSGYTQTSLNEFFKNYRTTDRVGAFFVKFRKSNNFDSIVFYTEKAIKGFNEDTHHFIKFSVYYKLGCALLRKQDYFNASIAIDSSIQIGIAHNLRKQLVEAYRVKGVIANYKNLYDEAIDNYKIALSYADAIADKISLNTNLSSLYIDVGKTKLALEFIDEFIDYNAKNPGVLDSHTLVYNYLKKNNFKKASLQAQKYIQFLKKGKENLKEAAYIKYGKKYQAEKKTHEYELLKKENIIKDLEIKKQTTRCNYLIFFYLFGLIFVIFTYNRFRLKRNVANSLAKQNEILKKKKVILEKSNANKQKLFSIISHDLIGPFNAVLGYTKLLDEDYENFTEKERKKFIHIINTYANKNYILTRSLLDWAKVQQDRLKVRKSKLNFEEVIASTIASYQLLADKKNINVRVIIGDKVVVEADRIMMQTVIGNLFINAIKFSHINGTIIFKLYKNNEGKETLEIRDNGIGMNQEELKTLFDLEKVNIKKGTNNERGNGIGLVMAKELIELQNGTLQILSEKGKGSIAIITI
ncbi:ATP-binding protein [Polaribacter sp. MSW13]|uniref:histidine kinase n=1 Tax=Polaribacter marinus TaxID=2916838 RepID=A0A9X1VLD7_9FLAO|nr:ATP-binding protein [Polaribacter marinus]MCI2228276.1 ATP-binding protein [Polaribacter marinus]